MTAKNIATFLVTITAEGDEKFTKKSWLNKVLPNHQNLKKTLMVKVGYCGNMTDKGDHFSDFTLLEFAVDIVGY